MTKPEGYHWLTDKEYKQLKLRTEGAIGRFLKPLRLYGQGDYVDSVIPEILDIIEQTWEVVRGKDKPIVLPRTYMHEEPDD